MRKDLERKQKKIKRQKHKCWLPKSGFFVVLVTCVIAVLMYLLPYWIIPRVVPEVMNNQADKASVFLSAWSLEVAIGIAFLIYFLQRHDSQKEHDENIKAAENAYKRIAKTTVDYLLSDPRFRDTSTISSNREQFLKFYGDINEVMLEEDRIWLDQLIAKADMDAKEKIHKFNSDIFRDWLKVFVRSKYCRLIADVEKSYDLLDERTYQLLQDLNIDGTNDIYKDHIDIFRDSDGHILFKKADHIEDIDIACILSKEAIDTVNLYKNNKELLIPKLPLKGAFTIIDIFDKGEIVFSGTFNNKSASIHTGYEKANDYQGFYKNCKYEGIGYSGNRHHASGEISKIEEGFFHNNILRYGIKYGPYTIWQKGEFSISKDGSEEEFLLSGAVYDFKGGKLKEGTFTRDYNHNTINGTEYNWIIKMVSGRLKYNKQTNEFDGDDNTVIEEYLQYYNNEGYKINSSLDSFESYLVNEGFDRYYIADIEVHNLKEVIYKNIRRLDKFMMKEDSKTYKNILEIMQHN